MSPPALHERHRHTVVIRTAGERGTRSRRKGFREYAVFRSVEPVPGQVNGQGRVTILAWINDGVSLVLIGKGDLSQLMDIGQSINDATGTANHGSQ